MENKKIILLITILAIGVLGISGYYYIMHGGERNLSTEDTAFCVTSNYIMKEFDSNIETANSKYLEKAIVINGTVTKVNGTEVIIDKVIICHLKELDATIQKGQKITLKGRVVGFDDLMGELNLDQCFKNS